MRTGIKQQDPSELPMFDHQILVSATNKFNTNNKLGEGGFGPVFKVIQHVLKLFFRTIYEVS